MFHTFFLGYWYTLSCLHNTGLLGNPLGSLSPFCWYSEHRWLSQTIACCAAVGIAPVGWLRSCVPYTALTHFVFQVCSHFGFYLGTSGNSKPFRWCHLALFPLGSRIWSLRASEWSLPLLHPTTSLPMPLPPPPTGTSSPPISSPASSAPLEVSCHVIVGTLTISAPTVHRASPLKSKSVFPGLCWSLSPDTKDNNSWMDLRGERSRGQELLGKRWQVIY